MVDRLKSPAPISSRKVARSIKRHQRKSNRVVPIFITRKQKAFMSANNKKVQKQTTLPQRHVETMVHDCGYWFDKACPVCLEESYPLDNYLELPDVNSLSSFGALEVNLPRELIDMILYRCDILSLTRLRLVNRRARQLVSELPQYKVIVQYVPRLIRYMLDRGPRLGIVCEKITLEEMYSLATEKNCYQCLNFSIYIDLMERKRICVDCFEDDQRCYSPFGGNQTNLHTWKDVTIEELKSHYRIIEGNQAKQPKPRIIRDSRMLNYYMEKFGGEIPNIPYDEQEHRRLLFLAGDRHPEVLTFIAEDHPSYIREQFTKIFQSHSWPWKMLLDDYYRYLCHVRPGLSYTQKQVGNTCIYLPQPNFLLLKKLRDLEREREDMTIRVPWLDPETYKIYWE